MSTIKKISRPRALVTHALLWLACMIAVFPFLRVITISLRPGDNIFSTELNLIPDSATLMNYIGLLEERPFAQWVYNSLVITTITAVIGVMLAATAAYAFSRFRFPGRGAGLGFLFLTQMIPGTMMILPIYIFLSSMNLIDTYKGVIIAYSVSSLPFSAWILKGYYDTIPRSLEEAAYIDGCSVIQAFYRVILPLSKPALAIAFLFNFTMAWNDILLANTILQDPMLKTWPLGLFELQGAFDAKWGQFAAGSVMVSIPSMALFFYTNKYMLSGLTLGSVKG